MEKQLVKVLNEALSDVGSLSYKSKFPKVADSFTDNLHGEDSQGEYNESTKVYNLGVDNYFLKVVSRTDSYGDGDMVHSIQIVTPVVKQVTDYEPIQ